MAFIERNGGGIVKGVYRTKQPGIADEELANDHPDVVAFLAKLNGTDAAGLAKKAREEADMVEAVADRGDEQLIATLDMTDAQINTAINNAFPDPAQRVIIKRIARLAQHAARGRRLR